MLPDEPLQILCCLFAVVSTISVSTETTTPIVGDLQNGILGKKLTQAKEHVSERRARTYMVDDVEVRDVVQEEAAHLGGISG